MLARTSADQGIEYLTFSKGDGVYRPISDSMIPTILALHHEGYSIVLNKLSVHATVRSHLAACICCYTACTVSALCLCRCADVHGCVQSLRLPVDMPPWQRMHAIWC